MGIFFKKLHPTGDDSKSQKSNWKILTLTLVFGMLFIGLGSAKAASKNVTGYSWADTIGWIQMSGTWTNGVTFDDVSGNFSGYAWSDNIGWVNFAPAGPYPLAPAPSNAVKVNLTNGEVSGWAQVISIKDCSGGFGGCGWISMRGSNYGVKFDLSIGQIAVPVDSNKWAWSDDFGWIDFSAVKIEPKTAAKPTGGPGNLIVKVTPNLNTTAYLGTQPILVTNGSSVEYKNIAEGAYTITFDPVTGYITPQPREVSIGGGLTQIVDAGYHKPVDLKGIDKSSAETLYFDYNQALKEGRNLNASKWKLTRGVSAISADDGSHWQYSAAEVLVVGVTDPDFRMVSKSDGVSLVSVGPKGGTTEYDINLNIGGGVPNPYNAILTDTITTDPPSEISKIQIIGATLEPDTDGFLGNNLAYTIIPNYSARSVVYTLNNRFRNFDYKMKLKISIDGSIASNTKIINTLNVDTSGFKMDPPVIDEDMVIGAYLEEAIAGDVYGKGVRLRDPSNVTYVIGSSGNLQAISDQNWKTSGYTIRSESNSAFDLDYPGGCPEGSGCWQMNENIKKITSSSTPRSESNINANINFTSSPEGEARYYKNKSLTMPEGEARYYKNKSLTIGPGGAISIKGKGTILVENGDLVINSDIIYADSKSVLGIIVKNGNVIINPDVRKISGIFYIYSEKTSGKGSFIVNSKSPKYDYQFEISGSVVSSGVYSGGVRKDAFILSRNYIGPIGTFGGINVNDPTTWEPAELFKYDGRVIINPPPGFTNNFLPGRQ